MPKKPIDYANSSIYKLCCRDTDITDCYVGSTTNFRSRKWHHKSSCNNENDKDYNLRVYQFIREHGGWENWDMILIEKVNANDNYELKKEERRWIEQLNSTLNQIIPTRTLKEWYQDNKDKKLKYSKETYINNKESINERHRQWYKDNREKAREKASERIQCPICNSIVRRDGLSIHKKRMKCINASK